jgi:hypothetical protein
MTEKKGRLSDMFPNLSAPTATATKEIADEDINSTNYKVKKFTKETKAKEYEKINILSENGDSIYSVLFEEQIGGQIFVAESKIEEMVNKIIDQRLGDALNNNKDE